MNASVQLICVSEVSSSDLEIETTTTDTTQETTTALAETTSTLATVATVEQIDYSQHYETLIAISLVEVFITSAILGALLMKTLLERFK